MRPASEVMAELAASGLSATQVALVIELSATVAAEARPTVDRAAENKRSYDRERQREIRRLRTTSYESSEAEPQKEKSPTPPKEKHTNPTPKGVCPKRGSRLPDEFEVPTEWIDYAVSKRRWTRGEATEEAEIFCRHWQAATGPNSTKRNWFKAWQNWVAKSYRKDGPAPSVGAELTPAEHRKRAEFFTSIGNDEKAREHLRKAEMGVAEAMRSSVAADDNRKFATGPPGQSLGKVTGEILRRAG